MIRAPTSTGCDGFVPHVGRAVFNTAIHRYVWSSTQRSPKTSHVDTTEVITSDRPTTLAFVRLADGHATHSFYAENSAGRMLAPDDLPEIPDDIFALYFGGISLASDPGGGAYQALLVREGDGSAVMIDPNIRPDFIEDESR